MRLFSLSWNRRDREVEPVCLFKKYFVILQCCCGETMGCFPATPEERSLFSGVFLFFAIEDPIKHSTVRHVNLAQIKADINIGDRRSGMTQSLGDCFLGDF